MNIYEDQCNKHSEMQLNDDTLEILVSRDFFQEGVIVTLQTLRCINHDLRTLVDRNKTFLSYVDVCRDFWLRKCQRYENLYKASLQKMNSDLVTGFRYRSDVKKYKIEKQKYALKLQNFFHVSVCVR